MTTDTAIVYAARRTVLRLLGRGELSGSEICRLTRSTHRAGLARALAELRAEGAISASPAKQNGVRYRLREPVHPSSTDAPERRVRNADLPCTRCLVNRRRPTGPHCGRCLTELSREPVAALAPVTAKRVLHMLDNKNRSIT